ncbi:hypothetical protein GIB67_016857 [Kingdonia uniflora]|uniref:Uncharacterized protein n=1 Tax=Kingdonia uniflora TaxID=39325 RepID=A0A7J7LQ61_9MAGN|nr:hypothetical protein GIB67_016857 [Kingdonia uniflora]
MGSNPMGSIRLVVTGLCRLREGGDSFGVNIVHNMAMQTGDVANSVNLLGVAVIQPYFWGKERIGSEGAFDANKLIVPNKMWTFAYSSTIGHEDSLVNPFAVEAPSLSDLGCTHMFLFSLRIKMFIEIVGGFIMKH